MYSFAYIVTGVGLNAFLDFVQTWTLSQRMVIEIQKMEKNDESKIYCHVIITTRTTKGYSGGKIKIVINRPPKHNRQSIEVTFSPDEQGADEVAGKLYEMFNDALAESYICHPTRLILKKSWNVDDWSEVFNWYYKHRKSYPYKDLRWLVDATGRTHQTIKQNHARFQRNKQSETLKDSQN